MAEIQFKITNSVLRVLDREDDPPALHGPVKQIELVLPPSPDRPAVDFDQPVSALKSGLLRRRLFEHLADYGLVVPAADHENHPYRDNRKQEIECRTGENDRGADRQGLVVELLITLFLGNLVLPLVQHLDVSAKRHDADAVLGRIARPPPVQDGLAEADRKLEHLDPEPAGHPVVPELVDRDKNRDRDQESRNAVDQPFHESLLRPESVRPPPE